jgi:hypothetical protein
VAVCRRKCRTINVSTQSEAIMKVLYYRSSQEWNNNNYYLPTRNVINKFISVCPVAACAVTTVWLALSVRPRHVVRVNQGRFRSRVIVRVVITLEEQHPASGNIFLVGSELIFEETFVFSQKSLSTSE